MPIPLGSSYLISSNTKKSLSISFDSLIFIFPASYELINGIDRLALTIWSLHLFIGLINNIYTGENQELCNKFTWMNILIYKWFENLNHFSFLVALR